MKLTIDTEQKTVEIDSAVNTKELIDALKSLLGNEWKEYAIVTPEPAELEYTPWCYPVYLHYPSYIYPTYPLQWTTCDFNLSS